MSKTMLIDACHAEETRVVVLNGRTVEDFDFESRGKKQLRGNIYLAKVTRVEPSLQAAFVEYGGNRHGFLAFNEIHPDYYQIPHADREALLREAEEGDDDDDRDHDAQGEDATDHLGGDDEDEMDEEVARRRRRLMRRYKIQEVIKRRQIMLVQVVKEERGNKGAALTTYLSLAGRYCVLMPNTDRGGGISRKITAATDRKRLRSIVSDLEVPKGMGLIVRTAGAKRTKAEIKRDYEYLSRAWGQIRDTTLHSIAPALIYEEEDLVKRSIRDLYDKDVENIWVEGEAGFREARDFMRMLMPSQAKKIQLYRGPAPLFVSHKVEQTLQQIYSPTVPLKSGGYLVINQTEALVAIDVNSGRSTRERNIEATALKTNLEAAEEAARQLRLRDLAGLIIIDFIDMEETKNNRAVEKVLKDCLALDRARIQMGKISAFGLMEISRQRRRSGILEGTTHVCPHCAGAGRVRSTESSALSALRDVELEALQGGGELVLRAPRLVALYLLNQKRDYLARLVGSHGVFVRVEIDESLMEGEVAIDRLTSTPHEIDRSWRPPTESPADFEDTDTQIEAEEDEDDAWLAEEEGAEDDDAEEAFDDEAKPRREGQGSERSVRADDDGGRRRGRRRRRGRGDGRRSEGERDDRPAPEVRAGETLQDSEGDGGARRRRRGRRGGRRGRDEHTGTDVYAWSWPARLSGDDPYEWRGPQRGASVASVAPEAVAPMAVHSEAAAPAPLAGAPIVEIPDLATTEPAAPVALPGPDSVSAPLENAWVELPPAEEPKPKARRRRKAPEKAEASTAAPQPEAPVELAEAPHPEPVVETAAPVSETPVTAVAEPEAANETVKAARPAQPPAPPPYDATEIVAPAAAPKRGWWRRGA